MVRAPCCEGSLVKKGPWTPAEDILLVSYIKNHGPGNWKAVATNAGLRRCSKSCRLRWTNYLRPGIKRGNFSSEEEKLIVHLQAIFGNRWAAIASFMPERTDNDVKNHWNTHLKKKLQSKVNSGSEGFDHGQLKGLSSTGTIEQEISFVDATSAGVDRGIFSPSADASEASFFPEIEQTYYSLLDEWLLDEDFSFGHDPCLVLTEM